MIIKTNPKLKEFRNRCLKILYKLQDSTNIFKTTRETGIQMVIIEADIKNAAACQNHKYSDCGTIIIYDSWIDLPDSALMFLIGHELTHILHLDYKSGWTMGWPPSSRKAEFRADRISVLALRELGVVLRLEDLNLIFGKAAYRKTSFFDTHPSDFDRIEAIISL